MKIAIIGSGIAGNVAAYKLHQHHDITVFEANDYIGGHTHTHDIDLNGMRYHVDSGFIVYNDWTYPNFIHLLGELGVRSQPSNMSFSVKCEKTGLEYNGTTINSLFAQRRNLFKPSFYRMINDILRFNKQAKQLLQTNDRSLTLGEFLKEYGFSQQFIQHYIIPMGAAIWSADPTQMFGFPAYFFARFFNNHGMLNIDERPTWRVIKGGSQRYVEKLIEGFKHRIRLNTPIAGVARYRDHVEVTPLGQATERFDQVFFACHSNQALRLLSDASREEQAILGAIPYQKNTAVLHTDESILPRKRLAWAAWNYHIVNKQQDKVALTYNMNILQSLSASKTFCVTLNHSDVIDPNKIIKVMEYEHPVFTLQGIAAQKRQKEINGVNRTYYCGAYWRNGFHEDGVISALNAVEHFNERIADEQLYLRRAS
jgi:predicted NAD/FAD-binding protein